MTQHLALDLTINADNVDDVIAKLRAMGATARGEAAEGVNQLDNAFERMADRLTERFGIWEALDKITEGIKDIWEATEEADSANQRLAASLAEIGDSLESQRSAIEAVEGPLEQYGFYTQAQLNGALATLNTLSGDWNSSLKALSATVFLAHYRQMDLGTAAMYVTKAMEGQVGMLGRYIPGLQDADDKVGFIRDHLRVFADADAKSAMGATERLATAFKELAESFGLAAVGESHFSDAAVPLADAIKEMTPFVEMWGKAFGFAAEHLADLLPLLNAFAPGALAVPSILGAPGRPGAPINVPMIGSLGPPGSAFPGLASALAGGGPPMISLGPTEEQQKEQEKYDKLRAERAKHEEEITKKEIEAALKLAEAQNAVIRAAGAHEGGRERYLGTGPDITKLLPPGSTFNPLTGMGATLGAEGQGLNIMQQLAGTQKDADKLKALNQSLTQSLQTMWQQAAQNIINAFTSALSGHKLSGIFAGLGKDLLKGFGQMFMEQGQALLAYSAIMKPLTALLSNPFTAGPAAAAAGIALIALGAAFNAIATSGAQPGSGSAGGSSVGSVSPRGVSSSSYLLPTGSTPFAAGEKYPGLVQPVFNVVGSGDPRAQSDIIQLLQNAVGRGHTVPGIAGS
jgi:hypothetical protein